VTETRDEVLWAVRGMTCAACAARIEKVVGKLDGVDEIAVSLATERARIAFDATRVAPPALQAAIERAGFEVVRGDAPAPPDRSRWVTALSVALAAPLVVPMTLAPLGVHWMLPAAVQLALALPVQVVGGWRFYRGAWAALRGGSANMDVLVALGTTAAFALSLVEWSRGSAHLWFESAAVVIALVRVGKELEGRARRGTAEAVRALGALRPDRAEVLRGGVFVDRLVEAVQPGDVVRVAAHARAPVDGVVREGSSELDLRVLTGESAPVLVGPGSAVPEGAENGDGALIVVATAPGAGGTLSRVSEAVERASASKAPIQRLADRVSAVFVPGVVALAAATAVGWGLAGAGWVDAARHAATVLVVACPCALGLATPAALAAGTGAAARRGVLFRDAASLERLAAVDLVLFDKTGTLTTGEPAVVAVHGEADVVRWAAAAQVGSRHPIARALRAAAPDAPDGTDARAFPGRGVEATVDGATIRAGSASWLGVDVPSDRTVVAVARDGAVVGWVELDDPLRDGVSEALGSLRARGLDVGVVSGDRAIVASRVAASLGITDVASEVLPEGKAAMVEERRAGRVVAFVGDGVNDAPALAAADVGVAVGTGADAALATAGVALLRPEPQAVVDAVDVARATSRNIRQNLFLAFAFNVVALPLAAVGAFGPALAGLAMAASSVTVTANALRLNRLGGGP
jgi:Cu+-exporting ATPase